MSNEYPPRPTEMCEPVINGTNVASDVYDYYINNKLQKAIDEYWQSKYPTFATGRIKRMRTYLPFRAKHTNIRPFRQRMGEKAYTRIVLDFGFRRPSVTRWNRH